MLTRNNTFFVAIILAVAFSFFKGTFSNQPVQSPNDTKEYRYLELDNGLRTLLISDEGADHAAASLDVNVGSLQDPKHRAGLAHFLEHMLFLGTKTYPVAGEYQSYISQHGGSHNAFTAAEHTNYYFQIDGNQLEGALNRFSRFFYEPLFTEEYVQREKNAVHSEYQSKLKDDYRRIQYTMKSVMNPSHPASHFSTGSLETLSDTEDSKVRDDLLEFYQRYYSANLMTLTIYGPQDLATLETWAKTKFNAINNLESTIPAYPEKLFIEKPLDIQIQPVKDLLNLSFTFELSQPVNQYKEKSPQYIGHLLGHEGEGSLLAWLKSKGWAEGLSAGLHNRLKNNAAFQVNISLSQLGTQHIDEITEQLFAYVQLIKQSGVQTWIYDELQQIDKLHFTFEEGSNPSSLVQALSMDMHEYDVTDILQGAYLWSKFNPEHITELIEQINPSNLIRTLTTPSVTADLEETWFNAPYSKQAIAKNKITTWENPVIESALHIPAPNPFIPMDVSVLTSTEQEKPYKLDNTNDTEVWYLQDVSFTGPQSSIYINLRSNLSTLNPSNEVLIDAWINLLNDHLSSFSYPAYLAGQNYSLYSHSRGIGIRLYGYRDKQDVLLEKILTEIKSYTPTQEQWLQTQQALQRAYQNALKQKPYERTISELNQLLIMPSFSESQLLDAINEADLDALMAVKAAYFNELKTIIWGHGNITEKDVVKSSETLQRILLGNTKLIDVPRKTLKQLSFGLTKSKINAQHNDSAMTLYFQSESKNKKDRAIIGLLAQVIKAPYYTYMRTEQKYGYIVFATPYPMLEQAGLGFIVQSPTTPANTLISESESFIKNFVQTMEDMTETDFEHHQQGLINNLLKKPLNLQQKTNRLWAEIDRENTDFNTTEELADLVATLTKPDIIQYLKENIIGEKKKAIALFYDPENK